MRDRSFLFVVLGLTFVSCLFTVVLDWDHVWMFILQVSDPINFTGVQGRPFHTVGWFFLFSIVAAFVFGLLQSRLDMEIEQ